MEFDDHGQRMTSGWKNTLPLHIESVGIRSGQETISREHGYFCFHWLSTVTGCGAFSVHGQTYRLNANEGILIPANTPHRYLASGSHWTTWYLTFDGSLATSIVASLAIPLSIPLQWDEDAPLADIHQQFGKRFYTSFDMVGPNGSLEVYSFLILLKQYARVSGQPSFAKWHRKLTPLLIAIEEAYSNPNMGLAWMAQTLQISPQRVNSLFRSVFDISPYQYVLQLRIVKSKEFLLSEPDRPIHDIAHRVGFYDASHFISTFRKFAGMTPETFRRQHFG